MTGGAELDAQDGEGRSALIYAARSGEAACVGFLASSGCSLDLKDAMGRDAEAWAIKSGHVVCAEIIQALRERRALELVARSDLARGSSSRRV